MAPFGPSREGSSSRRSALITGLTFVFGSLIDRGQILGAPSPVQAAHPPSSASSQEGMDYAERFMRATYPKIAGERLQYRASTFGLWDARPWNYDSVEVQINPRRLVDILSIDDVYQVLLNVVFEFNAEGLSVVRSAGQLVSTQRMNELTRVFEDDGPWTERRVQDQLRRAGATYYDNEAAVAARLPREAWRSVFGEVLLSRGTLGVSDPGFVGPDPTVGKWSFVMSATRPVNSSYEVFVEPFGGNVSLIHRLR